MKKSLIFLLSLLAVLMFSCGDGSANNDTDNEDDVQPIEFNEADYVKPKWNMYDVDNNEFYIKQQVRTINRRDAVALTDAELKKAAVKADDDEIKDELVSEWSGDFYLKYKVIQSGLIPQEGDELYKYANLNGKKSALTIIKGELDNEIQSDDDSLDAVKPALYLVIREDLGRIVAAVYFQYENCRLDENGNIIEDSACKRTSEAYDLDDPSQKANFLSTTSMFALPSYMPSFPLKKENQNIKLEDGTPFKSTYSNNAIEVNYTNKLDGTTILQKWDDNGVWAKETITSKMKSTLMTKDEHRKLKRTKRRVVKLNTPNDNFRSKLMKAVNLGKRLKLSDQILADLKENEGIAETEVRVPDEYLPWSGSYWPLDTASLAYGYAGDENVHLPKNEIIFNKKYDHPLKDEKITVDESMSCDNSLMNLVVKNDKIVAPEEGEETLCEQTQRLASQADALYQDIQNGDATSEIRTKRNNLRSEMTKAMSKFFTILKTDMHKDNEGPIQIHDGKIIGYDENDDEIWSFDLDKQSPMMKYAIWHHYTQPSSYVVKNPFYIVAWEILNSYHPMVGTGWWGHCNGWSGATIFVRDPATLEGGKVEKELINGEMITFDVGDLKGLLTESFYSGASHFYGSRYNDKENDHDKIKDLVPSSFHKLVSIYLRDRQIPFVFDTYAGSQVWNFPVYGYDFMIMETTDDTFVSDKVNINTADVKELDSLNGVGKKTAENIIAYREHNGPFQKIEDLMKVKYITKTKFKKMKNHITVGFEKPSKRTFDVDFTLYMASDSYAEDFAGDLKDSSETRHYNYTLTTDKRGNIIGDGEWGQDDEHPDFAWIPYSNYDSSRGSENAYLKWSTLKKLIPASLLRIK